MLTFILLAALALAVGVSAVAIPLLKTGAGSPPPAPWAALGAALVLVAGSAGLYATFSNWSWSHATASADSPQTMVARLARRLEEKPDDLNGWLMLGHSYVVLQEYGLAARSYERADRLAGGRNADALVGEAEALVLGDDNQLAGRAGRLLEQALVLAPNSGKALFYGAAAAVQRGELPLARERFSRLLAMNPPDSVKGLLQQQISAIDQQLAGGGAAGRQAPGAAEGPAVRVTVQLPAGTPPPDAATPLYVLVRDPAQPGPPLAAKRLASHFPQTIELTSRDSPMGRTFAPGQKVQVVARISPSGNPMAASGDRFGEAAYLVGRDGLVSITINQVTP